MAGDSKETILGIDLGTTSVKVSIVDACYGTLLGSWSRSTLAAIDSDVTGGNEQDPGRIIDALQGCLGEDASRELVARVGAIGVCGQMHGVMMWGRGRGWGYCSEKERFCVGGVDWPDIAGGDAGSDDVTKSSVITDIRDVTRSPPSRLYTWQDNRCNLSFLRSLPPPASHLRLATGYGCATLFWLAKHRPAECLAAYNCAATVQDFVVAMLCGLERPVVCAQNAASWGYFDTVSGTWNTHVLSEAGFPVHLLPTLVDMGTVAGRLSAPWCGVRAEVPILVAMGDLQCSILPKLQQPSDAIMNVSTSAQLTIRMPNDFVPTISEDNSKDTIEYVPYFNNLYLGEAASLNGGNVFAAFVAIVRGWVQELGLEMTDEQIWNKLNSFEHPPSLPPLSPLPPPSLPPPSLIIRPTLFGERHDTASLGSVSNISPENVRSLVDVYRSLSVGVISNLAAMMPADYLRAHGITRIVGNGTALAQNGVIRRTAQEMWGIPLVMGGEGDAALGAALAVIREKEGQCGVLGGSSPH